eukprot:g3795.t1
MVVSRASACSAVQRLAARYSVEVTPAAARKVKGCFSDVAGLRAGTTVNVTYLVGADIEESISTCERLARAGMRPVAHVPARSFASLGDADEYLTRLRGVGVDELLLLGGGAEVPTGALHESMQLLEAGLPQKHGFSRVGVAAHPEGHPDIGPEALRDALLRKAAWAHDCGAELYYETQFCFEPEPIAAWERDTRAALREALGADAPLPRVRLGVAGPAKISALIKFGAMSGVGNSLRFVSKYAGNVLKLASKAAPDELLLGLARHQEEEPESLIEGLHYYPFGGFQATLRWANAVEAGHFDLAAGGAGFTVRDG